MGPSARPKPTDTPWKPLTRGANIALGTLLAVAVALLAFSILALAGAL